MSHIEGVPTPTDTSPEALRVLIDLYRRMTPAEKARRVNELTLAASHYALAGLSQRHPGADGRELLLRLAALRLGEQTVTRVYGWRAEPDGA